MITEILTTLDTVTFLDIIIFFSRIEGLMFIAGAFNYFLNYIGAILWESYGKYYH